MDRCDNCKVMYVTASAYRNHCYQGYCSRYCFEAKKINLKQVDGKWPVQWLTCDVCCTEESVHVTYYQATRKNSRFCSKVCYERLNRGKRAYRQFQYMLPLQLYQNKSFTSKELAQYNWTRMIASCSAGSIAGSIRKWVARGIITYDSESKQYNYPHPEPLASMMIKYI